MSKKKILVWETLGTVSGGQKMTLTVLDMLADQYEFHCLIPTEGLLSDALKKRGIPYTLMGDQSLPTGVKGKKVIFQYGKMSMRSIRKSVRAIKDYHPDILYAPGPAALPWSAWCGARCKKPVVWHLHHVFLDGPTKKLLNLCSRWKAVDTVVAVSDCVGAQIAVPEGAKKVTALYNPVDFDKYAGGRKEKVLPELEAKFGSLEGCTVLSHVALVQNEKRQSFVLDVIKQLRDEGKQILGLFPGECRDEAYLAQLKQKAEAYGIADKVWFMGRRNDVPDLLKATDVLMIPSSFEGFPLAGLEAAAAGVPVAACDAAGAEEFVRVSGDGACFKENDAASAAEAVGRILEEREEMTRSGVRFAAEKTYENYSGQLHEIFARVGKSK